MEDQLRIVLCIPAIFWVPQLVNEVFSKEKTNKNLIVPS